MHQDMPLAPVFMHFAKHVPTCPLRDNSRQMEEYATYFVKSHLPGCQQFPGHNAVGIDEIVIEDRIREYPTDCLVFI